MTEHNRNELLHKTGELYQQFIENQDEQRAAKLAAVMKKRQMKRFISRLRGIIQRGNHHC